MKCHKCFTGNGFINDSGRCEQCQIDFESDQEKRLLQIEEDIDHIKGFLNI